MDIKIITVSLSPEDMAAGHHLPLLGTALGQPSLPPAPPPPPPPYYPPGDWTVPSVVVPPTGPPPPPSYRVSRWDRVCRWGMRNWVPLCLGVVAVSSGGVVISILRTPPVETAIPLQSSPATSTDVEASPPQEVIPDAQPPDAQPAPPPQPEAIPESQPLPVPPVAFPAVPRPH
jgi:U5 snRNP spliceosome subunit